MTIENEKKRVDQVKLFRGACRPRGKKIEHRKGNRGGRQGSQNILGVVRNIELGRHIAKREVGCPRYQRLQKKKEVGT